MGPQTNGEPGTPFKAPGKKGVDQKAFQTAMYSMKAMVPEKSFEKFVGLVNAQPGRHVHYKPSDFTTLPRTAAPQPQREAEAPVLRPQDELHGVNGQ